MKWHGLFRFLISKPRAWRQTIYNINNKVLSHAHGGELAMALMRFGLLLLSRAHGGEPAAYLMGGNPTLLSRAHGGKTVRCEAELNYFLLSRAHGGKTQVDVVYAR